MSEQSNPIAPDEEPQDLEEHAFRHGPSSSEPAAAAEPASQFDDDAKDIEGHARRRSSTPEPADEDARRVTDEDDDVEGHSMRH